MQYGRAVLRPAVLLLLGATRLASAEDPAPIPAVRYGQMSADDCEAELRARAVEFTREPLVAGVLAPVRLRGPLHGVTFRTNETEAARAGSIWEVADCRLALALDDFAQILAAHDVVEVRHYSMYRRVPARWPDGKIGSQHRGGLAIDAARFIRRDGTALDVLDDFRGQRGARVCGKRARPGRTEKARELRAIACAAVEQGLFNVVLTPNFNRAHRNHFHLEVTAGVRWRMVR